MADTLLPYSTAKAAFWGGFRAFLPIVLGVVPFGLIYGVAAVESGLSTLEGIGLSIFMFAGAAQLVTVELIKTGTPIWLIVFFCDLSKFAFCNLQRIIISPLSISFEQMESVVSLPGN